MTILANAQTEYAKSLEAIIDPIDVIIAPLQAEIAELQTKVEAAKTPEYRTAKYELDRVTPRGKHTRTPKSAATTS